MSSWWLASFWEVSPVLASAWVAWVIVSITLHELSHGWMAVHCGDNTPVFLGHMTPNPLVHIPWPMAWITFALFGFTWGLMPVNPRNFGRRYDDARVALAGPGMNLLLALLCAAVLVMSESRRFPLPPEFAENVRLVFRAGLVVNLVGVLFNLVPIPPLDGWRALSDFVPAYNRIWQGERGGVIGIIATWGLFWYGGAYIYSVAFELSDWMVDAGLRLLA
ncbi:MAG: site-2 protease family protein [Phycisphaerales bacterium]|jgi:Zn-dependent protease